MTEASLRALVVDDEALIRQLAVRALSGEGFCCDLAGDGVEAQHRLAEDRYDLVVTDLCMPHRHGHALASELLERPDRPLVVVLTALADPRMTKDLLARGVDDVMIKPVDFRTFAAKVRALVNRRMTDLQPAAGTIENAACNARNSHEASKAPAATPLSMLDFEIHLAKVSQLLPISPHILEVSELAQSQDFDSQKLAAAIQCDGALAVEVLRIANSSHYNPTGSRILELPDAIPRVGQRRVGELAMSMHALRLLKIGNLPWMDRELAWRRSVAAGLAADLLVAQGEHAAIQSGLILSASMHGLGRVTLGLLFPQQYDAIVAACREHNETMQEHESRVFPVNHAAAMARILQTWSVPANVYQPLRHTLDDFNAATQHAEPLRSKIELVKLAVLLGWIAVGPWESWDRVELPSEKVFERLRIADPGGILHQVRDGMKSLIGHTATFTTPNGEVNEPSRSNTARAVRYRKLSDEPNDLLAQMFEGMGLAISTAAETTGSAGNAILVNCFGASPAQVAVHRSSENRQESILLVDGRQGDQHSSSARVVQLPTCYAAFRTACEQATV